MQEKILILDFGSPYTQLLARRVRELNVYCEIVPFNKIPAIDASIKGVILSGSPFSVNDSKAFVADLSAIKGKLPLLGVCYGAQMVAKSAGAKIETVGERDYGRAQVSVTDSADQLLCGVSANTQMWMSLGERITSLPAGISTIATGEDGTVVAYKIDGEQTWGVDFHPEVYHSTEGPMLFKNFVIGVCGCKQNWTAKLFVESTVAELKQMLGDDKVVLGLSGGVDSSVSAVLLHKAIGANLVCIFVDTGLMRKNEPEEVLESYKNMGLNVIGVCAKDKFLGDLLGVTDPEQKRKIIGRDFIEVFDAEAKKIKDVKWLGQGTIYPDIVESVSVTGPGVAVKSHHNVGGLPEKMKLSIVEPLKLLFKDEVRRVGKELGISPEQLGRHPFPGPGLGIRVLGEVTAAKIDVIQQADKIFIDALKAEGLYDKVWQAGCMLLPAMSVGVSGDQRTYENALALRVVNSVDGMTADWVELPYSFLGRVSNEIISKVKGINRVVYDVSSKPPATIEWE